MGKTTHNEPPAPHERTYLAGWKCPECGRTQSGWITEHDNAPRACLGIAPGGVCGAIMQCVYSDRPRNTKPAYQERTREAWANDGEF